MIVSRVNLQVEPVVSQGISLEFNAVGGLDESIQKGIGNRWIGHVLMPVFHGQLTGCDG